jgi:hypothetical protein
MRHGSSPEPSSPSRRPPPSQATRPTPSHALAVAVDRLLHKPPHPTRSHALARLSAPPSDSNFGGYHWRLKDVNTLSILHYYTYCYITYSDLMVAVAVSLTQGMTANTSV